ncbi:MAG: ABC transporter permease [Elusimicrobia bacterium]|nr:ABC transporter permease [Elusimicrobiota bacterium]
MKPWSPSYWFLLWELTRTEFKVRDQGTVFGFLWTLLHPALMFAVLYALFISWFDRFVEQYAAYLIVGLVQWQFFEKATSIAITSLRRKDGLIRNFKFPLELIVFSAVGSVLWSYLLETGVLLGFLLCLGLKPTLGWPLLPAVVLAHLAFTLGVSLVLALAAVEFQDLDRVWGVLTTAGFYLTPVFYPLSLISQRYGRFMAFNPLLHILGAFRACLVPGQTFQAAGLFWVVPLSAALCVAGVLVFRRRSFWITDRVFAL